MYAEATVITANFDLSATEVSGEPPMPYSLWWKQAKSFSVNKGRVVMLSNADREVVVTQIKSLIDSEQEKFFVESYLKVQDKVKFGAKEFYPALLVEDEVICADVPPERTTALLFTPAQIAKAAETATKYTAEGDMDQVMFCCVGSPSVAADVSAEEEEAAVVDLVLEHFSAVKLFKLAIISLTR